METYYLVENTFVSQFWKQTHAIGFFTTAKYVYNSDSECFVAETWVQL